MMDEVIKKQPTTLTLYAKKLEEEGTIDKGAADTLIKAYRDGLDKGENTARNTLGLVGNKHTVNWAKYRDGSWVTHVDTTGSPSALKSLSTQLLQSTAGYPTQHRDKTTWNDSAEAEDS